MRELTKEQQQEAIKLLKEAYNAIGMAKYELGEDWDAGEDDSLEGEIGGFLNNIGEI